ncbi:MAG: DUF4375 domain-containing protein [Planctomycetes bacterium]|nr:DUF4375 domain-containing protein [Planctomycetota bacterium]
MDEDERSPLPLKELDDALWLLLLDRISSIEDVPRFPRPVLLYFASRYVQWDVGNGGFAQAAYNIPEWFGLAREWYRVMGKTSSESLLEEALRLIPDEAAEHGKKGLRHGTIAEVFAHFDESRMSALDERIISRDWEIDDERVEYVRRNRDSFLQVK